MNVSVFSGKAAHEMKYVQAVKDLDIKGLAYAITQSAWSPFVFSGNHRHSDLFQSTDLIVLDIDEGMSVATAISKCKGETVIIGTTKNHQKEKRSGSKIKPPCDRFRIIKILERPITSPEEYRATWKKEAKKFGCVDQACKDLGRFYYKCENIVYQTLGTRVPVAAVEAEAPKQAIEVAEHGKLTKATYAFIHQGTDKNWHTRMLAALLNLKEQGYTKEEATELCEIAASHYDGKLDDSHDIPLIEDVFENDNRGGKYEFQPRGGKPAAKIKWKPISPAAQTKDLKAQIVERKEALRNGLTFIDQIFDQYFKLSVGLTFIGGRTGSGKSTTCYNIIASVLKNNPDKKILIMSNEASLHEVSTNVACLMLNYDWKAIYSKWDEKLDPAIEAEVADFIEREITPRLTIAAGQDPTQECSDLAVIEAILEYARQTKEYSLVIIDYLQLVTTDSAHPDMSPIMITKALGVALKDHAKKCGVPVVIFGQLAAESDSRKTFGTRIELDKTFLNHVYLALETLPDYEEQKTYFQCHKNRLFGDAQWKVGVPYFWGRLGSPLSGKERKKLT